MEMPIELLVVGVTVLIVLLGVLVIFGMKPTDDRVGTPASGADGHPANASSTAHGAAYRESGATGVAAALYALGVLALLPPLLADLRLAFSTGPRHPLARDASKQGIEVNGGVKFALFFDCHGYLMSADAA